MGLYMAQNDFTRKCPFFLKMARKQMSAHGGECLAGREPRSPAAQPSLRLWEPAAGRQASSAPGTWHSLVVR